MRPRASLYEPEGRAGQGGTGRRETAEEDGKSRTQPFLMHPRLNSPAVSSITVAPTTATSPSPPLPPPITPMTKQDGGGDGRQETAPV